MADDRGFVFDGAGYDAHASLQRDTHTALAIWRRCWGLPVSLMLRHNRRFFRGAR